MPTLKEYIRLCILVILFSLWARKCGSLCYLSIHGDGSCSLEHIGVNQYVLGFPFIKTAGSWRPVKWFWQKLMANEKVEPDWEVYAEACRKRYKTCRH